LELARRSPQPFLANRRQFADGERAAERHAAEIVVASQTLEPLSRRLLLAQHCQEPQQLFGFVRLGWHNPALSASVQVVNFRRTREASWV
jgi:hypothetical protein